MKNKEKILIALASLSFILVVYLIIVSKEVQIPNEKFVDEKPEIVKVDLVALENDYKNAVKVIYGDLKRDIESPVNTKDNLENLKIRLMSIRVPEEYRTFHIGLVMLIDSIIEKGDIIDDSFKQSVYNIGLDKEWLN